MRHEGADILVNQGEYGGTQVRVYKVLFLEDNPDDVELMVNEITESGMATDFVRVDNKANFIRQVLAFKPDIVLADYSLPMFNGVEAFKMLRRENVTIPFILVTGVLSEQLALECLKDGIDDFVLKSSFRRLPSSIVNAIQRKEMKSEKERMTVELEKSHKELVLLLNRHQQTIEEERKNIARDLHDELGQVLTALKIDVMMFRKKFDSNKIPKAATIDEELNSIVHTIEKITASVKAISSGLRPETLDALGILDAIRWQVAEFEKRNHLVCHLDMPDQLELNKELSIAVFRIVQEALTNVARHAVAKQVEISLVTQRNTLLLEIKDNGRGIREAEIQSSKSLGLIGLRERVRSMQGEFRIGRCQKGGTEVIVSIPFDV